MPILLSVLRNENSLNIYCEVLISIGCVLTGIEIYSSSQHRTLNKRSERWIRSTEKYTLTFDKQEKSAITWSQQINENVRFLFHKSQLYSISVQRILTFFYTPSTTLNKIRFVKKIEIWMRTEWISLRKSAIASPHTNKLAEKQTPILHVLSIHLAHLFGIFDSAFLHITWIKKKWLQQWWKIETTKHWNGFYKLKARHAIIRIGSFDFGEFQENAVKTS